MTYKFIYYCTQYLPSKSNFVEKESTVHLYECMPICQEIQIDQSPMSSIQQKRNMHLLLILPYYLLQQPQKNKIRTLNSSRGYKSWAALIVVCGHYQGVFRYVPTYYDIPIDRQYYSTPFCMYLCRMKTALLLGIDQLGLPLFPPPQHFSFSIVVVQHAYNEIFFGVISSIEVELAYQERDIILSDYQSIERSLIF